MTTNAIELETVRFAVWQKLHRSGQLLTNPERVERAIKWGHAHHEMSAGIVRAILETN